MSTYPIPNPEDDGFVQSQKDRKTFWMIAYSQFYTVDALKNARDWLEAEQTRRNNRDAS